MKNCLLRIATTRASVRSFSREPISLEDIVYAIQVARQAPSGANTQPWRFIVVTDESLKQRIREACESGERELHTNPPPIIKEFVEAEGIDWRKPFLTEAPALILVLGRKGLPYWVQGVWLAIAYLILALEERGLASLTYTPPSTGWVHELLNVPKEYSLQAIIPIGKPAGEPRKKPRRPITEIAFCNKWGKEIKECMGGN